MHLCHQWQRGWQHQEILLIFVVEDLIVVLNKVKDHVINFANSFVGTSRGELTKGGFVSQVIEHS
jgi:hypothetical protein